MKNPEPVAELRYRRMHKASVVALAMLAEHKDPYASQHILRVSRLTDEITRVLQHTDTHCDRIDDRFRELLRIASMLHDVVKVTIPDGILQKPGRADRTGAGHPSPDGGDRSDRPGGTRCWNFSAVGCASTFFGRTCSIDRSLLATRRKKATDSL